MPMCTGNLQAGLKDALVPKLIWVRSFYFKGHLSTLMFQRTLCEILVYLSHMDHDLCYLALCIFAYNIWNVFSQSRF